MTKVHPQLVSFGGKLYSSMFDFDAAIEQRFTKLL